MSTWEEIIKRQRRRKPKKKVPNIFEGEKIPDNERFDQQKKEGRKGTPFKRTGEDGLDAKEKKEKFELSRQSRHHIPRHVSYEFGGTKRPSFYGKEGGISRTSIPKSRCSMCARRINTEHGAWMKGDRSLSSEETGRIRYCYHCMKTLGGPKGFVKDESSLGRTKGELNQMSNARAKKKLKGDK